MRRSLEGNGKRDNPEAKQTAAEPAPERIVKRCGCCAARQKEKIWKRVGKRRIWQQERKMRHGSLSYSEALPTAIQTHSHSSGCDTLCSAKHNHTYHVSFCEERRNETMRHDTMSHLYLHKHVLFSSGLFRPIPVFHAEK